MTDGKETLVVDMRAEPEAAVDAAVAVLEDGGVLALATDTVYGLAARCDDERAILEIYELKGRPVDRQMAILVADIDQAEELVDLTATGRRLATEFWPGALTIVAARRSAGASVGDEATLGVRCPADDTVRAIADRVGPLVATSANHHGCGPAIDARTVAAEFPSVPVVLDGGEREGGASTVAGVVDAELTMIRSGPIEERQLREVLEADLR